MNNNLTTNIGHIVIAIVIIGAAVALAVSHTITGGEAVTIIAGAGGVSLGGAVASSSAGAPVPQSVASLISNSAPNPHSPAISTNSTTVTTSTTTPNETTNPL